MYAVPLHKRPLYQGLFGAVFGLASVIGPLLGGVLTSNVSWRWCCECLPSWDYLCKRSAIANGRSTVYINLPIGGAAMVFIFFLLKVPDRETTRLPRREKLAQLDPIGVALLLPGVICLLLALQWGGLEYPWYFPLFSILLSRGTCRM